MKIRFLCECCGDAVDEAEATSRPAGGLTGGGAGVIMGVESEREKVVVRVYCTDCWEAIYGGYVGVSGFYSGPVLH